MPILAVGFLLAYLGYKHLAPASSSLVPSPAPSPAPSAPLGTPVNMADMMHAAARQTSAARTTLAAQHAMIHLHFNGTSNEVVTVMLQNCTHLTKPALEYWLSLTAENPYFSGAGPGGAVAAAAAAYYATL